ncbi:MAG: T9SS type A sorting domain-containing protein, partial [Chitinophagales bacterium]
AAPGVLFIGRSSGTGDIYRLNDAYTSDFTTTPFNADPFDSLPDAAFLSTIYCSSIVVDVNDANHVIVTYSNFNIKSIWESFDALAFEPHWHCIEGDLPDLPVYWSAIHPDYPDVVYIATELGVFYTDHVDGYATHWMPCSSFPIVRTDMLRIRVADKKIVAATHGRGLWESFLSGPEGINNILWRDRGPNNIGGRTRTIMIDPNDPTGKTVWAGSVGGGLWKTTDIDAVSVNETENEMDLNLSLFPNPAHTNVQINFTQNGLYQPLIYVIDMYGKQITSIAAAKSNGTQIINWEIPIQLANGNYFIVAVSGNNKIVRSLVIL